MLLERLEKIKQLINTNGIVKVSELSKEFGVSIETVRRDLECLEEKGLLKRVYGGAVSNASKGVEMDYTSPQCLQIAQKKAIARKTA